MERKKIEKEHYNKQAGEIIKKNYLNFDWKKYGSQRQGPILGTPFRFTEEKIKKIIKKKREKEEALYFLDYGCGMGVHSIFPAKLGAEVYGIDISDKSIEMAKEWAKREGVEGQTTFRVMDCEKVEFQDNCFDIVFNCGTLSCLDRQRAYSEIVRVLKPEGYLISVDTLGHNPFLNLNRKIKWKRGLRTQQTLGNILKIKDIEMAKQHFGKTEVYFYHLISWVMVPFEKVPGFNVIARFLENIDQVLLKLKFFQKYAFKVVFIFSQPRK